MCVYTYVRESVSNLFAGQGTYLECVHVCNALCVCTLDMVGGPDGE